MIELSDEQMNIADKLIKGTKTKAEQVVGGRAGCGKSTVLSFIYNKLPHYAVCAYTGKAVNVLRNKGIEDACTIHSLIYTPESQEDGSVKFILRNWKEFKYDGIIVDEGCLPYEQRIQLANGESKRIGEIVNQKKQLEVLSYNFTTSSIESKKITNWFKYPISKNILEIRCSVKNNREMQKNIRCTTNHQIYLEDGNKVIASDIKVGDKIIARGKFLNKEQKEFLYGSLLGDACIQNCKKSTPQITFRQGDLQKNYLLFKYKIFRGVDYPQSYPSGYNKNKKTWSFSPPRTDDLVEIYNLVYPFGKKTVSEAWLEQITPLGLAAWYMDDGHLDTQSKRFNVYLHTEGFSKKENEIIRNWLQNKYGLKCSIYKNKKYYILRLSKQSSIDFIELISPWFCLDMNYKLPEGYKIVKENYSFKDYKDHGILPVISINNWNVKSKCKYVYDIEVEGNHNYFTNNVLISNSMVSTNLYRDLRSFRVPLIFFGDHGQLEPIGDNPNLMKNPMYKLETIHRNAGDIPRFGEHLRLGKDPRDFICKDGSVELKTVNQITDEELQKTDQIICAFNKFRVGMNYRIRTLLGRVSNIEKDDKIMCLKNNKLLGLFNGMTGYVNNVKHVKKATIIDFENDLGVFKNITIDTKALGCEKFVQEPFYDKDLNPFDYAWTVTTHKSQGSEYNHVIVYDQKCDKWDHKLWSYTAATRAKKKLVWVLSK